PDEAVIAEVVSAAGAGDSALPDVWIEERGINGQGPCLGGVDVSVRIGVEERPAGTAAQPVALTLVIAIEASGIRLGLHDGGTDHDRALGHVCGRGLCGGLCAGRVAAATASLGGRGIGEVEVLMCSHQVCPFSLGDDRWMVQTATGSRVGAGPAGAGSLASSARALKVRSLRLFDTTNTEERAIAAPASIGLSSPKAARGIAAVL